MIFRCDPLRGNTRTFSNNATIYRGKKDMQDINEPCKIPLSPIISQISTLILEEHQPTCKLDFK